MNGFGGVGDAEIPPLLNVNMMSNVLELEALSQSQNPATCSWPMLMFSNNMPISNNRCPLFPADTRNLYNDSGLSGLPILNFSGVPAFNSMLSYGAKDCRSSSSSNSTRLQVYANAGRGAALVLDGERGELVNASKIMTPKEVLEAKAAAASKSHSEAERRRRERINNHLATLRTLLPNTAKTDKASLLAEVIEHLKDLKRRASEIEKRIAVPSDVDELKVEEDSAITDAETKDHQTNSTSSSSSSSLKMSSFPGRVTFRASLCCNDRPELLSDLNRTLHALRVKAVKAEISTLGGRTKNVFLMTSSISENEREEERPTVSLKRVEEALRAVMEERPSASASNNDSFLPSKRQRLLPLETSAPATATAAI